MSRAGLTIAVLVTVAMAGLMASGLSGLGRAKAAPPPTPNITIAGPGAPVAVGSSFNVQLSVDSGETLVLGYQVEIEVPAGLSFISATHEATGTFPVHSSWELEGAQPPWWVRSECAATSPTAFAGLVVTVTLRCDSGGTYPLNLVDLYEDPVFGSVLLREGGWVLTNFTPDGQETVTCYTAPPDTPTPTPTSTATPAAVGGIAELPAVAGTGTSGMGGATYAVLAGAAAGVLAFAVLATLSVKRWRVR